VKYTPAQLRKVIVAALSFAAVLGAGGVLHGSVAIYVQAVVAAAGTYGVFKAPNAVYLPAPKGDPK